LKVTEKKETSEKETTMNRKYKKIDPSKLEELRKNAKRLPDGSLEKVAGGVYTSETAECPMCAFEMVLEDDYVEGELYWVCYNCGVAVKYGDPLW